MKQGDLIRDAATIVDALESAGAAVEDVAVAADQDAGATVDLSLRVDRDAAINRDALTRRLRETGRDSDTEDAVPAEQGPPADRPDVEDGAETDDGVDRPDPSGDGESSHPGDADSSEEQSGGGTADPAPVACQADGCEETFGSDHGMKIHLAKVHGAADDEDAPPHRDPARLHEVYEVHDTFEAMRDALGADVTAQTVRRNMMKYDVHDPDDAGDERTAEADEATGASADGADASGAAEEGDAAGDTDRTEGAPATGDADPAGDLPSSGDEAAADGEDDRPTPAPDGGSGTVAGSADAATPAVPDDSSAEGATDPDAPSLGATDPDAASLGATDPDAPSLDELAADAGLDLPEGLSLSEVPDAVAGARTLYDVQRSLGIERATAQSLLAELDLLSLVQRRLADCEERATPDEVERRVRDRL